MEAEFIPYEQALALKGLGFDEPCFYQYVRDFDNDGELIPITSETNYPILRNNTEVSNYSGGDCFAAPTFSQAFKWFREKYKLKGFISPVEYLDGTDDTYHWCIYNECNSGYDQLTNEQAELECLKKLIEIVKNK